MRRVGAWLISITLSAGAVHAIELEGRINWAHRSELGTLVSGVVASVSVAAGQRVDQGQELLRLDDRGFKARVSEAQAQVTGSKVRHDEAQREEERAAELYDRTVLSDHERQLSLIAYKEAGSALQLARARLTQARLDLERSRIIAPYDAIVVRVDTTLGEIVVSELQSKPLLIVAEAGRMLAQVNVREDQIADIAKDSAAQVRVRDRWFDGIVTSVGLEPVTRDADGPLYLLEVGFSPASDVRLHVGESAIVRLEE